MAEHRSDTRRTIVCGFDEPRLNVNVFGHAREIPRYHTAGIGITVRAIYVILKRNVLYRSAEAAEHRHSLIIPGIVAVLVERYVGDRMTLPVNNAGKVGRSPLRAASPKLLVNALFRQRIDIARQTYISGRMIENGGKERIVSINVDKIQRII